MTDPIQIVAEKCVLCGACVRACPFDAITQKERKVLPVLDLNKCTLCGACVQACKFDAIVLREKCAPLTDLSAYKDVWVFAEQHDGEIQSITFGRPTLEDVFVRLTGRRLEADASETDGAAR